MLRCGLIGAGIQGSRSPALHQGEAAAQGLQLVYKLIDLDELGVGTEALPKLVGDAVREGYRGLNITFPCKQAVLPLLDGISDGARAIGAVNTVVIAGAKLTGHNTDGQGWGWGFRRALPDADLSRVVLLGEGRHRGSPRRRIGPDSRNAHRNGENARHAVAGGAASARDMGVGSRLRAASDATAEGGAAHRLPDRRRRPHERRPGDRRLQAVYRPRC
jgi:hypothetical protein